MELIPLNILQQASAITERLTGMLFIERVYLNRQEKQDGEEWELIILIAQNSQLHLVESTPLVKMVLTLYPNFNYRMFYISDIKNGLKFGNMTFFSLCQPDRLVYISPDCAIKLHLCKDMFGKIYKQAAAGMEKERVKIQSFRKGVWFYLAMENYAFCALMLHQLFECCYRFAELSLIGKEKISHKLRNHHKELTRFIPGLKELFNWSDDKEMEQFNLLDEAYLSVRYSNGYQIKKEGLVFLIEKSVQLEDLVNTSSRKALLAFQSRFTSVNEQEIEIFQ